MRRIFGLMIALAIIFGLTATANATLIVRGWGTSAYGTYQLIYDDDFDITWYDYTAPIESWTYQTHFFAQDLNVNFGGTIYDDWRLPTALNQDGSGPCNGDNCTGSEMGHLYYTELGNSAGGPLNTGPFTNLQANEYWSETLGDWTYAWMFNFSNGNQGQEPMDANPYHSYWLNAIAVRDGDVSSSAPIPEPASLLLLGSGLLGLAGIRRVKKRKAVSE